MKPRADAAQIRRWQQEVARDPGAPAFVDLAEVYRREGRLEVARRLCLRGLSRRPDHVQAHALLGRVYRESGDPERAFDEWDIALRLDPRHSAARRAMGYLCLERRDWDAAVRHLEAVVAAEPDDTRAESALELGRRRRASAAAGASPIGVDPAKGLAPALDRFVRASHARLALVLEPGGRVVVQHGFSHELDVAGFSTLAAGIHSASGALARMFGQRRFDQLHQGRGENQLFLAPFETSAGEMVVVVVFGEASNLGLVRVTFRGFAREAAELPLDAAAATGRVEAAAYDASLHAGLRAVPSGS